MAWLPTLLGLGAGDIVVIPELAYPTYEVGVRLAGAQLLRADGTIALGPRRPALHLAQLARPTRPARCCRPSTCARSWTGPASAARSWRPTSATSTLGWDTEPVSVLHPAVCGGSHEGAAGGALAVEVVEPRRLPGGLRGRRPGAGGSRCWRSASTPGMIVPRPVQAAMTAALSDDAHVAAQTRLLRRPARGAAARAGGGGPPDRPLGGGPVPVGDGGRAGPGDGAAAGRAKASWWHPGSSTVRRASGTCASR